MSTASEKATPAVEAPVTGDGFQSGPRLATANAEAPAADHAEAQLRARIATLQAQLAEVTSCLESAETRAAEVASLRVRVAALEAKVAAYNTTRSWRYTAPLRSGGKYLRRRLGR
jgi:hypothetical protein